LIPMTCVTNGQRPGSCRRRAEEQWLGASTQFDEAAG
jgi:hypothetical protein